MPDFYFPIPRRPGIMDVGRERAKGKGNESQ